MGSGSVLILVSAKRNGVPLSYFAQSNFKKVPHTAGNSYSFPVGSPPLQDGELRFPGGSLFLRISYRVGKNDFLIRSEFHYFRQGGLVDEAPHHGG